MIMMRLSIINLFGYSLVRSNSPHIVVHLEPVCRGGGVDADKSCATAGAEYGEPCGAVRAEREVVGAYGVEAAVGESICALVVSTAMASAMSSM